MIDTHRPEQPGHTPIIIVGAGPTGLVAALTLARQGISSTILEAKPAPMAGSRALGLSRRTLDIFAVLGVADQVCAEALSWTSSRSFFRNREIFRAELPADPLLRFPAMKILSQERTEQILLAAVSATGMVDIRWGCSATELRQNESGVCVSFATATGKGALGAALALACDGARSTLRKVCELRLEGESYAADFVIVDVRQRSDTPPGRRAWFDIGGQIGRTALMHRHPGDLWRIDYQLPADADADDALRDINVRRSVGETLAMAGETAPWEIAWVSSYRAHALLLPTMRHGRVMFAGDAAHILPIFGVKGLNTGVDDAFSLAWFSRMALDGDLGILDAYSIERLQLARHVLAESMYNANIMAPPNEGSRMVRDAALSLSLRHPRYADLLGARHGAGPPRLASPLHSPGDGGLVIRTGDVMPNVRLGDSETGDPRFLFDILRAGRFALIVAKSSLDASALDRLFDPSTLVVRHLEESDVHALAGLGLEQGGAYLLRPDHLVAASWARPTSSHVEAALRRLLPDRAECAA